MWQFVEVASRSLHRSQKYMHRLIAKSHSVGQDDLLCHWIKQTSSLKTTALKPLCFEDDNQGLHCLQTLELELAIVFSGRMKHLTGRLEDNVGLPASCWQSFLLCSLLFLCSILCFVKQVVYVSFGLLSSHFLWTTLLNLLPPAATWQPTWASNSRSNSRWWYCRVQLHVWMLPRNEWHVPTDCLCRMRWCMQQRSLRLVMESDGNMPQCNPELERIFLSCGTSRLCLFTKHK